MIITLIRLIFCVFICIKLQAEPYILVIPTDPGVSVASYQYSPDLSLAAQNGWQRADKTLQQYDRTILVTYFKEPGALPDLFRQTEKIICCNLPHCIPNWKDKLAKLPKEKRVLITYEPPSVMPEMFDRQMLDYFGTVLTWDDTLVDNIKFFKFNYQVLNPMIPDVVPFSQKKWLTQISGNKTSAHPDELYSERVKVIKYFEKTEADFDFYGTGWENLGFRNYKGKVDDKIAVLKEYKFSICYENIKGVKGYITEKIFDCFQAGVVPIYWGASNIKDYVPANCFIAREDFANFEELVTYLKTLEEKEYNQYLENIRVYLESAQAKQFSSEAFENMIYRCLEIPH